MRRITALLSKLWRSERVAVLTGVGAASQAIADTIAAGGLDNLTWATLGRTAAIAFVGVVARHGVWSRDTVEHLGITDDDGPIADDTVPH
jgi:hypothetical protein